MKAKKCHAFFVCMSEMVGTYQQITNSKTEPMGLMGYNLAIIDMSERHIDQIIEDDNTVTVIAKDDDGKSYVSSESHNGSSWDRNDAIEKASEDALNKW